jgi:hypothetical protein
MIAGFSLGKSAGVPWYRPLPVFEVFRNGNDIMSIYFLAWRMFGHSPFTPFLGRVVEIIWAVWPVVRLIPSTAQKGHPHIYRASAALLIRLPTIFAPKYFRMVVLLVNPVTCMISAIPSIS